MSTTIDRPVTSDPVDELRDWLEATWDPDLTVGEWWERLGLSGWAAPTLPVGGYGKGLSRTDALRCSRVFAEVGALGPPLGMGIGLVSPTIATHGTPEQVERYIRPIVTGLKVWCQLFSEPGAGSDLAGLGTKAVRDGDVWVVNGQKVWTSGGHLADHGMLLARTNPDAPKHQGITWFAFDMHQPGVEVRPLKEMTGHTMFSEVFFTDAHVHDDARIGDLHNGWKVAQTTLFHERSGMGERGGAGGRMSFVRAGANGDLDKRAGDLVRSAPRTATKEKPKERQSPAAAYIRAAKQFGRIDDPTVRQDLVTLHTLGELARMNSERQKGEKALGREIPGLASFSKLAMARVVRLQRDLGLRILGPHGMLHAYEPDDAKVLAEEARGGDTAMLTAQALGAQALPIYGGTDQIQRNIIGERALGLPKEPGDMAHVPFSQLPRNQ